MKSFKRMLCLVVVLSILTVSAGLSATTVNAKVSGVSGIQEEITGFDFWFGYKDLPYTETSGIDTLSIPYLNYGNCVNFSYTNEQNLDPNRTVIKVVDANQKQVVSGRVYGTSGTSTYCMFGRFSTSTKENYLVIDAYDYAGNKYYKKVSLLVDKTLNTASSYVSSNVTLGSNEISINFNLNSTRYNLIETGIVDTLVVPRLPHGTGASLEFSIAKLMGTAGAPYYNEYQSGTIKVILSDPTKNITTNGFLFDVYRTAFYGMLPVSSSGELYLYAEAYDKEGNKYTRNLKIIHE